MRHGRRLPPRPGSVVTMMARRLAFLAIAFAALLALPRLTLAAPAPGDLTVLSGLADITEPPVPGFWPPNALVSALAMLAVLALLWLGRTLVQRQRRRRPYRAAQQALRAWALQAPSQTAAEGASELTALLRRLALLRYPRSAVAPLSGDAFLAFLDQALKEPAFQAEPAARFLGSARYGPTPDSEPLPIDQLMSLAERWLKAHRDGVPRHV